jgi:hypothetical protein
VNIIRQASFGLLNQIMLTGVGVEHAITMLWQQQQRLQMTEDSGQ